MIPLTSYGFEAIPAKKLNVEYSMSEPSGQSLWKFLQCQQFQEENRYSETFTQTDLSSSFQLQLFCPSTSENIPSLQEIYATSLALKHSWCDLRDVTTQCHAIFLGWALFFFHEHETGSSFQHEIR